MDNHHQPHRIGAAMVAAALLAAGCSSSHARGTAPTTTRPASSPPVSTVPITTVPITTAAPVTRITSTTVPATTATTDSPATTVTDPNDLASVDWVPIVQRLQDRLHQLALAPSAEGVAAFCVPGSECDQAAGEEYRAAAAAGSHSTDVPIWTVTKAVVLPSTFRLDGSISGGLKIVQLDVYYAPRPTSTGTFVENGVVTKTIEFPSEDGLTPHPMVLRDGGPEGDEWRVLQWTIVG